jgi:hypothetical protein
MKATEKYDRVITGLISGFILPVIIGLVVFMFTHGHMTMQMYLSRISESHIITHSITLCVFPNILIFLLSNRLDMLNASKGVLAITIVWAILVFVVKFI